MATLHKACWRLYGAAQGNFVQKEELFMKRKEWMRVVAALAAFAMLGTGSAVTAAAEETGAVVSETESAADQTVFTGSCGEDATWTYDKSTETLTIMGTGSVEAYVKAGVMIKTPGWQTVNDYAAKHIVIGEGITEVGEGFLDTCIYGTTDPRTLQVSSTVTQMDLKPALQEKKVTFYGTKGSWFYEQVYETNRFVDIATGEPDKVPTSGTYSDGASWNYDEKSETLTISGDGGITEKEFTTYFGWDRPVKRIVIGKDVKLPDWNSDVSGLNLFFRALISDAETGNGPFLSIYPDSEAGKAYEDLVAYRVSKGSTENEVRSALEEVVAFLDADITHPGDYVAVGDVNQDGRVDVADAVLLSKAVNGSVSVSDAQKETMDCDGDGDITANDVTTLMRFLVHLETELPPKQ